MAFLSYLVNNYAFLSESGNLSLSQHGHYVMKGIEQPRQAEEM